ncbi:hypothetical protein B0H14DRAFT_1462850 [Mycena olivaceomarginata]|nr:hypothetical protein B0H14DRAFT_1462850 [Mycena olivaceomarginata]
MKVQNFNAGGDGSTSVSVEVDQTGTGKKFVAGKVTKNGNPKPSKVETDQVTFSLPAGTKCAGGKAKNLCLVSVKTTSGFGACTVVSQGKAAANPPPKAAAPAAPKPQAATSKAPSIAELAAKNKGKKTVFETCAKDSDCQQGCCGFSSGKCAGPDVAQTNGSGGCGHGNKSPNCDVATLLGFKNCIGGVKNGDLQAAATQQAAAFAAQLDNLPFTPGAAKSQAAAKPPAAAPKPKPATSKAPTIAQLAAKNKGKKTVFETCAKDSDCQQGCCGFKSGKCAGPDVAQTNGSGGCGHGNKSPNCDVATLLGFKNCIGGVKNGDLKAAATQQAAAFAAQLDNLPFKPSRRDMAGESVEAISRREILQQGKFAPRLLKAREAALELEGREYEEELQ